MLQPVEWQIPIIVSNDKLVEGSGFCTSAVFMLRPDGCPGAEPELELDGTMVSVMYGDEGD